MTLLEQTPRQQTPGFKRPPAQPRPRRQNVGSAERAVSLIAGSILAVFGVARRSIPGVLIAGMGGAMLYRGATGRSSTYSALGINTARPTQHEPEEDVAEHGIHVQQVFTIGKSPEELYAYWRNFENLPHIMSHLFSVRVMDDRRSHWVADAPALAGGHVEWDAEITRDEPNACIAWRSLPGADVDNIGEVRFTKAPGDRGTQVRVLIDYVPPAGRVGHWIAMLFGKSAKHQIREDLRKFKQIMETGEAPTISGQPRGTCTGTGEIYRE